MVAVTPGAVSASSTKEQVVADVKDVLLNGMLGVTNQDTPADVFYHNGTVFTGSGVSGGTWGRTQISAAPGLAALASMNGWDSTHWTVQRATNILDYAVTTQQPDGEFINDGTPNTEFIVADMGEAIALLDGKVAAAKIDAWTASMLAGAGYLWTSEQGFYTNGNVEILSTYAFDLTYRITGDSTWATRRDTQYTWTVAPSPINPPEAAGSGLRYTTLPALPDGSDGRGYLTEYAPGVTSPGLDRAYAQLSLTQATRWLQVSRDPRAVLLVNVLHNLLFESVNTSTWLLDAAGGTRLSTTDPWWTPATAELTWRGWRQEFPADRPAAMWAGIHNHWRRFRTDPSEQTFRAMSNNLMGWLRAAGALGTGL